MPASATWVANKLSKKDKDEQAALALAQQIHHMASGKKAKSTFANMTPERHLEVSRMGGTAVHKQGKANKFTSEQARAAGLLGLIKQGKKVKQ